MSGHGTHAGSSPVTRVVWLGLSAHYTPMEHATMQALRRAGASADELAFLHTLKATFNAREIHPLDDSYRKAA